MAAVASSSKTSLNPPLNEACEIFRPAAVQAQLTLASDPICLKVFRNGLLLAAPDDYSRSGRVVTFAAGQEAQAGDIVQAHYFAR